jgi:hypothetical protein
MAPGQKKGNAGPANGAKKKGYNPYNKFKNRFWKKKKHNGNDEAGSKSSDTGSAQPHLLPPSPTKIVQTPISLLINIGR